MSAYFSAPRLGEFPTRERKHLPRQSPYLAAPTSPSNWKPSGKFCKFGASQYLSAVPQNPQPCPRTDYNIGAARKAPLPTLPKLHFPPVRQSRESCILTVWRHFSQLPKS